MRCGFLLACVLVLASCAQRPDVRQLGCAPVEGVEQVLAGPGVFIGDMHGSVESPAFLSALACHVVKSGRPLVVAMEYDAKDQAALDRFLAMADEKQATSLLTRTSHWTGNRDGRASGAMRDALLAIRGYARAGGDVELMAYDFWGSASQERDSRSADYLQRKWTDDGTAAYWIVFGGNVHARKIKGLPLPGYEGHEPLGYLIRDWGLIHLDAAYGGGTGWGCTGPSPDDCSTRDLGPGCSAACPPHPVIRLQHSHPAYDGVYDIGRLTVSRPLALSAAD